MKSVYLIYCLSGLVSLGYQIAWFRIYVDRFGSTNLTFALVLSNFILGLGAGSLLSRPISNRLSVLLKTDDRLRIYGWVELLVAATVMLTLLSSRLPADMWGHFPYVLENGIYEQTRIYQLSKLVVAAVSIFVPCFFMGVTFPLLCYVFQHDGRFPAKLYAWNTLGACSAVLLCQFLLLQWLGHDRMLWLMMGLNCLLGGYFVVVGGSSHLAESKQKTDTAHAAAKTETATKTTGGSVTGNVSVLLLCAILSGLLSGSLEADMFRRVRFLGGYSNSAMSFVSFWAILAIFLASWTIRALPAIKLVHIKFAYVAAVVCYSTTWNLIDSFAETNLVALLVYSGIIVFPTFLLTSTLLPYVCNRIQSGKGHLGLAYGANTLAFSVGIIGFTWIAPRVNIFYSFKLFMVLMVILVGLLLMMREKQRLAVWTPIAAVILFLIGCWTTPADFDSSYFAENHPARLHPVRAMKSNGAYTTFVVEDPEGDRLFFETYTMSSTAFDAQVYMRLMAHFPLLVHPHPENALLICFGCGNTASAIAGYPTIKKIDVVDLNEKVIETAPEFAQQSHNVHRDERISFIHDDGRNFLNVTDRTYDLVTSEPPPPMYSGVYRLYSQQYYQQVLAHLSDRGMMTQWLPVYQMPKKAVEMAIKTFVDVFPHTLLLTGQRQEFILLGSRAPIDLALINERFYESPRVTADLRNLKIADPMSLQARVVKGDATLRREYAGIRSISDQHNDFAFLFADVNNPTVIDYNPLDVVADFPDARVPSSPALSDVVKHLGRLRYHVPKFPLDSLATIPREVYPQVALADIDWLRVRDLYHSAHAAFRGRQIANAVSQLEGILDLNREQPHIQMELASLYLFARQYDKAVASLQQFRLVEPEAMRGEVLWIKKLSNGQPADEFEFHNTQGLVYRLHGDLQTAVRNYQRAIELKPDFAAAHNNLGVAFSLQRKREKALTHFRRALELDPDLVEAAENLERVRKENN